MIFNSDLISNIIFKTTKMLQKNSKLLTQFYENLEPILKTKVQKFLISEVVSKLKSSKLIVNSPVLSTVFDFKNLLIIGELGEEIENSSGNFVYNILCFLINNQILKDKKNFLFHLEEIDLENLFKEKHEILNKKFKDTFFFNRLLKDVKNFEKEFDQIRENYQKLKTDIHYEMNSDHLKNPFISFISDFLLASKRELRTNNTELQNIEVLLKSIKK